MVISMLMCLYVHCWKLYGNLFVIVSVYALLKSVRWSLCYCVSMCSVGRRTVISMLFCLYVHCWAVRWTLCYFFCMCTITSRLVNSLLLRLYVHCLKSSGESYVILSVCAMLKALRWSLWCQQCTYRQNNIEIILRLSTVYIQTDKRSFILNFNHFLYLLDVLSSVRLSLFYFVALCSSVR